jgi:hypothetical protein
MAYRKSLFMSATGYPRGLDTGSDGLETSGISITNSSKITGLGDGTVSGDALAFGQSSVELGDLSLTSGNLDLGSNKIVALANGTSANEAINYSQLQDAIDGRSWKDPVAALNCQGESATEPLTPASGDTYISTASDIWGTATVEIGDVVQYDGSDWVVIVVGTGTEPTDGVRILNNSGGDITLDGTTITDNHIGTYESSAWVDEGVPLDGEAFLVYGDGSINEDTQWAYNGTSWVQVGGPGIYSEGDGVVITGNSIAVDLSTASGLEFNSGELQLDINTLAGLEIVSNEVGINLHDTSGLEFFDAGGGGLRINIDSTGSATTALTGDELVVQGLPSLFTINGTAVGATVTSPNFDTLTDGSNADALHIHSAVTATDISQPITCGEDLAIGEPVYISASDTVGKATSDSLDVGTKDEVIGVCTSTTTSGNDASIAFGGAVTVTGLTMTAGARQYLSDVGGITETRPSNSGDRVIQIGFGLTATKLSINIMDFGQVA